MSGDYRPEVGDIVKMELEVTGVGWDGSLNLKPTDDSIGKISTDDSPKVELVRRKPPVLQPGDVVYKGSTGGVYLVGFEKTSLTVPHGEVIDGGSVEALAEMIARRPDYYRIVKHKENAK